MIDLKRSGNLKKLNLIPKERRLSGLFIKFRLVAGIVLLLPVIVYGYGYVKLDQVKTDLVEVDAEVSEGIQIETSIKSLEDRIKALDGLVAQLSEKSVPLNHFLKFMGDEMPETMKIHSIVSESIVESRLSSGKTSEGLSTDSASSELIEFDPGEESNDVSELSDGSLSEPENNEAGGVSNGNPNSSGQSAGIVYDSSKPESGGTSEMDVPNSNVPESGDAVDIVSDPNEKSEHNRNIGEGDGTENLNRSKDLIIRGYSTSVSDLGHFISRLNNEVYVSDVKVSEVVDYYNGLSNYKFFELHVIIGDASDVVKDE